MKFSGPIEDRMAIQDVYNLYADASSRGCKEDWLVHWTEDAHWNSHLFNCPGKAAISAQWDTLWANFAALGFLSQIGPIEVDGDTARARSYAREIIRLKDGGLFKLIGGYEDYLRREDGEWRFYRRDYHPIVEEFPETA